MKKHLLIFFACCTAWGTLSAQVKTYIGMEGAFTHDSYEIIDYRNNIIEMPLITGFWGFTCRQELNQQLSLETGLIKKDYDEGFGFKGMNMYGTANAIEAWMIPLRVQSAFNLYKEKIRLTPVIGYIYCINRDYIENDMPGGGGGSGSGDGNTCSYDYDGCYSFLKTFSLLQTGMQLEFMIAKAALFSISASHYAGFQKIVLLDVNYTLNGSSGTATVFSKGEMFSLGASLSYPVSNLWTKK